MPRDTLPENAPARKNRVSLDGVGTTTRMDLAVDRLGASAHPTGGTCRPVVLFHSGWPAWSNTGTNVSKTGAARDAAEETRPRNKARRQRKGSMRAPPLLVLFATGWRRPIDHTRPNTVIGTRMTRAAAPQGWSRRPDGAHAQSRASLLPGPEGEGRPGVAEVFPVCASLDSVHIRSPQGEEGASGWPVAEGGHRVVCAPAPGHLTRPGGPTSPLCCRRPFAYPRTRVSPAAWPGGEVPPRPTAGRAPRVIGPRRRV